MTLFDERLKNTEFIVEADSFAELMLWKENHTKYDWKELNPGYIETIKSCGRPTCISLSWTKINNCLIMFYYPTSQLVDHKKIDNWLLKHCNPKYDKNRRRAHCDAMNFHHCLQYIREKCD